MKNRFTLLALFAASVCSPTVFSQTADILIQDTKDLATYAPSGQIFPTTPFPSVSAPTVSILSNDGATNNAKISVEPTLVTTRASDGTNTSTVIQGSDGLMTRVNDDLSNTFVRVTAGGAGIGHVNASSTIESGLGISDSAIALGNLQPYGGQYNGTYFQYDATTNFTQIGSYDSTGAVLSAGLQSDGITGINTIYGSTLSNSLTNTGNIATDTLSTTGNATLGGTLAVTGASTTNGITNTGNIATDTLSTTGNATVGGNLAVRGTTSTHGIDNNGQVISNVAAGVAATDAANVGQLNSAIGNQAIVNSNQAFINNNQANINSSMQMQLDENRRVASTGTAIVAASAAIPALEAGKKIGVGAGVGTYDGRPAVAVGLAARISQSLQIKLHIGTGSGGRVAAGAGGIWSW